MAYPTGIGSMAAAATRKAGELDTIVSRLGSLVNEIEVSADRIGSALDRINGSRPSEARDSKNAVPIAGNTLSEMRERLERLERVAQWLGNRHTLERLDSFVSNVVGKRLTYSDLVH